MWKILQPIVMQEPTMSKWMEIAEEFERKWQFPNCIGALDGKHVICDKPAGSGSMFFNYKKTFSLVLLALVDANYKFIVIDVGAYGRSSDSGIFRSSSLGKKFFSNNLDIPQEKNLPGTNVPAPFVIVGDAAFPLHKSLLRPYPEQAIRDNDERRVFNYRLCRARRVSENAFGILTKRFRIYQRKLQLSPRNMDIVVMATCVLHNFLRIKVDSEFENRNLNLGKQQSNLSEALTNARGTGGACSTEGLQSREKYKNYFNTVTGSVQWQQSIIRAGRLHN